MIVMLGVGVRICDDIGVFASDCEAAYEFETEGGCGVSWGCSGIGGGRRVVCLIDDSIFGEETIGTLVDVAGLTRSGFGD